MSSEHKYDVAFSFLQQDEELALDLADRVRDRISVFIYSEQQKELAGSDGVDTFTHVFAAESRVVVVLYREGWGHTRWTRVEETAIKTRWFNEGYSFLLVIALDKREPTPTWLPPMMIYLGLEAYGIDGAAATIESKVQACGGNVRQETTVDRALAVSRKLQFDERRRSWRYSSQALDDACRAVQLTLQSIKELADEINRMSEVLQIDLKEGRSVLALYANGITLQVGWSDGYYSNSLEGSIFLARLWKGQFVEFPSRKPELLLEEELDVDVDSEFQTGWRERTSDKRFYTPRQFADHWLTRLFELINC